MTDINWTNAVTGGIYTVPQAARLLAAKPEKVRSWIEAYSSSNARPILERDLPRVAGKTVLSFLDLVESAFVRHFLALGYSPQTIRSVAVELRQRHGTDHPFAMEKRFKADGKSIFEEVVADDGERRLVNLMNDNFEIVPIIQRSLFDQVFYVNDIAHRWMPLAGHERIVVDPKIALGQPVVRDVWVPTERLAKAYMFEGSAEAAADEWGVAVEDVFAAVQFEQELEARTLH
ncbi:hypothetical protein [Glycocaulis sp.]